MASVPPRIGSHVAVGWRGLRLDRHNQSLWSQASDLANDLGLDRLSELMALSNWDHKCARATDDTVAIVFIKLLDIPVVCRTVEKQGKTVDDDTLVQGFVSRLGDGSALIVDAVPRDVDHPPHGFNVALVQELHTGVDGPRDGGTRTSSDGSLRQPGGKAESVLGAADLHPRDGNVLDRGACPFQ